MRFDDLEIVDLNGDEEEILQFPSDNPHDNEEKKNSKDEETENEKIDWKKEVISFATTLLIAMAFVFVLKNYKEHSKFSSDCFCENDNLEIFFC